MRQYTEKRKASNKKWDDANLKRMSLAVPAEMFQRMQAYVAQSGETVNGFIKRGIELALLSPVPDKNNAVANDPEDTTSDQ